LPPLFTTSVATSNSTPALSFTLSNAAANTVFGNCTTGLAAPSYCSITGAMLPNPSASTLGGIQSYNVVSNQWLDSISTSGVPHSSQPGFANLSGTLNLAGGQVSGLLPVADLAPGSNGQCLITTSGVSVWGTCTTIGATAIRTATKTPGCTTAAPPGSVCADTLTWSAAFADTNYVATCSGTNVPQGVPVVNAVQSPTTTTISVVTTNINQGNVSGQFASISCIGVHP